MNAYFKVTSKVVVLFGRSKYTYRTFHSLPSPLHVTSWVFIPSKIAEYFSCKSFKTHCYGDPF